MTESDLNHLKALLDEQRRSSHAKSIAKLAAAYDEYLLERNSVDDAAWLVLLDIFNDPTLLSRPGIDSFLMEMNVDLVKYSPAQLQQFLDVLVQSIGRMTPEISRHAAGDFIARAYPPAIAFRALKKLAVLGAREKHAALVGLDVLLRKNLHSDQDQIEQMYQSLIASRDIWKLQL